MSAEPEPSPAEDNADISAEATDEKQHERERAEKTMRGEMSRALFHSKLGLYERTFTTTSADIAINICSPNITDGFMFFDEIHALAGPRLIKECRNYEGMQHGSCRVTRSFNATNFQCIIHTTLPGNISNRRVLDVELAQTAIRRCLCEAVARGARTIAFPSFLPAFSSLISTEFLLKVISNWICDGERKGQLQKLQEIQILCHTPTIFRIYRGMVRKLFTDYQQMPHSSEGGPPNFDVYAVAMGEPRRVARKHFRINRRNESRAYDEYAEYAEAKQSVLRHYGDGSGEPAQVQLELSAKLQPSVLVLDDRDGKKRQYRLTNKSKDGRKLYFRCSYCDTLIRKTQIQVRAKITLQDGVIVGDHYPEHHPDCKARTPEELMVQQIDRKSRREVKEGKLAPREAYEKARQLAMQYHHEMVSNGKASTSEHEISHEMEAETPDQNLSPARKRGRRPQYYDEATSPMQPGSLPSFPDWQRIRQQYFRMRKVGENLKNHMIQQRADLMREATFVVKEDEEDVMIEVDECVVQPQGTIDVVTVEPGIRKPRILHREPRPAVHVTANNSSPPPPPQPTV